MTESGWRVLLTDDLEKVLPGTDPRAMDPEVPLTGHLDERLGLQVAIYVPSTPGFPEQQVTVTVECAGARVALHRVGLVPAELPAFGNHDQNYYADQPSLLPDPLFPLAQGSDRASAQADLRHLGWNAIWIDLEPRVGSSDELTMGPVRVLVEVRDRQWHATDPVPALSTLFDHSVPIELTPAVAPATPIEHIAWLHPDGVALAHHTPIWSQLHWTAVENHIATAAEMGVTAVLTPVWTPSLDTAEGTYRPNVQLLDLWHDHEGYHVGTERLDRFTALMRKHGMRSVEVAHLFTQWGARHTPQIWVTTADGPELRFGWHVSATDPSYRDFLADVIPVLRAHLEAEWGVEHVLWHISDEPSEQHLDSYRAAREQVADLLEGAVIIDALSSPEFRDLVDNPIVATDHAHAFLERGLACPAVYYCVSQNRAVANRFIGQYAVGHRHLAAQMFVQQATTFLHWGFDFYWAQYAARPIDPFRETGAGGRFPSGDPFVVYPGPEGSCLPSLRHRVLSTMTQDARMFAWAESLVGRDAVLQVIDPEGAFAGVRGYEAPWPDPLEYRRRRLAIDRLVRAHLQK